LPIQLFFLLRAFVKNVAAKCDFQAQNTPKCVCAWALDPTGEAYKAPRPLAGFQGADSWQEREERGGEGGKKEKGMGMGRVHHFFFTIY